MMARLLLALVLLTLPAAALASGPQGIDALIGQYDPTDVAEGRIQVSRAGELAYVSGTSPDGPWMEVWRHAGGKWTKVAEVVRTQVTPIRFGMKRPCRRTS